MFFFVSAFIDVPKTEQEKTEDYEDPDDPF
jgi:hypothetical protein